MEEDCSALRLAVPREFWKDLDPEVEHAVDTALALLTRITAGMREISISTDMDRTVVRCEPYVYHQRYSAHESQYHPETLKRIRSGSDVTAKDYVEKYRELLHQRREILNIFEEADLIITPTTPLLPPTLAELQAAPADLRRKELILLRNTRPFNVYGLPAVSLCCGFSKTGLPIGLQIAGAPGAEGVVLALARLYEKQTEWHKVRAQMGDLLN
jgi:Asp-tRNA(Asn)/Glu-tRNA(Gln) amidotransferase A subunit family amidase